MYIFKIIKNTFYKKLFTKNIFTKIIFWTIGYWKKHVYIFVQNYLQKICLQVINYKDPIYPCPFMIHHTEINHRLSGYPFSYGTSMDGDDFITSEKKNEGLASVKKWRFSFRKAEIIQMSTFSLAYTPKKQFDLQSYSYCPFSIGKLMWWWWWFDGSLLKTCHLFHWSVWGEVVDNVQI